MINNNKQLLIIISVLAIIIGIFLRFYLYNKTISGKPPRLDEQYQFYNVNQKPNSFYL